MAPIGHILLPLFSIVSVAVAIPALFPRDGSPIIPDPSPIISVSDLNDKASTVAAAASSSPIAAASAYSALLTAIVPSPAPTSIEQALALAVDSAQKEPKDVVANALRLSLQGLSVYDPKDLLNGDVGNASADTGTTPPAQKRGSSGIYPQASSKDAPYSTSENQLHSALYLPPGFSNGAKLPVLLVPGTAVSSSLTYPPNLFKLLSATSGFDPCWLTIPGTSLGDAQTTAEYVAYAINYLSSLSSTKKVAVISWSQGSLDTQWALKYWPSTRSVVSDFVAVSPDFHGTLDASVFCPAGLASFLPCPAAIRQQAYDSNFVKALRANGGDQAYVPTTTVYSATDVVVTPQIGTLASGFLGGASNNEVQSICLGKGPAGGAYTHQGMLYHPLTWALALDALTHDGPGSVGRIDLGRICSERVADGLGLSDVLGTQSVSVAAGVEVLKALAGGGAFREPDIRGYAR